MRPGIKADAYSLLADRRPFRWKLRWHADHGLARPLGDPAPRWKRPARRGPLPALLLRMSRRRRSRRRQRLHAPRRSSDAERLHRPDRRCFPRHGDRGGWRGDGQERIHAFVEGDAVEGQHRRCHRIHPNAALVRWASMKGRSDVRILAETKAIRKTSTLRKIWESKPSQPKGGVHEILAQYDGGRSCGHVPRAGERTGDAGRPMAET